MKQPLALNQNDQDLRDDLHSLTKKDLNNLLRLIGEKCYGNRRAIDVWEVDKVKKSYFITEVFTQLSFIRDHNDHFKFPTFISVEEQVAVYDKDGKLVGNYKNMEQARDLKPEEDGHSYFSH